MCFILFMQISWLQYVTPVTKVSKFIRNSYMQVLQTQQKDTFQHFQPIKYVKFATLAGMQAFTGFYFPNTKIITNNIKDGRQILSTMCKLYNMTNGQILFPPEIRTFKQRKSRYCGAYGENAIRINSNKYLESTLIHEIAHYNHEQLCPDYYKMGKKNEIIAEGITDFSIFDEFNDNKNAKKLIKRYLGGYATSSPCEFVACTFESLSNGRTLPIKIWELYKKYDGPHANILKFLFVK